MSITDHKYQVGNEKKISKFTFFDDDDDTTNPRTEQAQHRQKPEMIFRKNISEQKIFLFLPEILRSSQPANRSEERC